jgi:hypothetical protein
MRRIFILLLSCMFSAAVMSQSVTIQFNGTTTTRNFELVLDGTSYYSNNANTNGTVAAKTLVLDQLALGTHTIKIYRTRANASTTRSGNAVYTKEFTLRDGYDMMIGVNGNGQITFTEKKIRNRTAGTRGNRNMTPMTDATFNQLVQTVNSRSYQSSKLTTVRDAFNNRADYFTTLQARQLIGMISSETSKLELAKLAYSRITDPVNIEDLYNVFANQSTRNSFDEWVSVNVNTNINNRTNNGNNNGNNNTSVNTNTRVAIDTYNYNQLLQTLNNSTQSGRYTAINNAFTAGNYTFTSSQVRQLLSGISSEADRLYLAKQSYLRVSDPSYFSVVYDLFSTNANRNDLNTYVMNNGGVNTNNTVTAVAIDTYNYNQLLQTLNNSTQSGRYTAINNAFTAGNYTFTAAQVRQLLSGISSEADRLYLAKQAYLHVSDPAYFSVVYDLFSSVNSRNELNAYVVNNGGSNTNIISSGTETAAVVAMSDAAFSSFMFDQKLRIFRSAKVQGVKDLLNTSTNYFTTSQVKQLVEEGKDEVDRIAIAKLAYRKTIDPANFSTIVDLIPSAAGKADVNAYIAANRY